MNLIDLISKHKINRIIGVSQAEDQKKPNQIKLAWEDKSSLDLSSPIVLMEHSVGNSGKKKASRNVSASNLSDHIFYFSKATGVTPSEFLSHQDPVSFIPSLRSFGISPLVSEEDSVRFLQKYCKLLVLGEGFKHNDSVAYSLVNKG